MLTRCVTHFHMPPTPTLPPWKKKISEWLQEDYAFLPEKVKKKYLITGIGHAGGCMFPNATETQLAAICRFCLWAFTIDDAFEFSPESELGTIGRRALTTLQDGVAVSNEPLYRQLLQLRHELLQLGSEDWLKRFCLSIGSYFDGLQQEVPFRRSLVFPAWEHFVSIRTKAVNVYALINLADLITGNILPDNIVNHPDLLELRRLTCRILSWSNDCFSAHLEKGNDVLNIVLMIENEKHCTMEDAYQQAIDFHNQDLKSFCTLKDALPDFGRYTATVQSYIENLAFMMHGHLHWRQTFTKRYDALTVGHPSTELKAVQLTANA
jgi:Terpene synthase family 2, C-terminal metal binding